jgi:Plasmid pRiA4b ORF-3-like protein
MAKPAAKTPTLVHIKVTLSRIRPAIWRRLLAFDSMTLGDLHTMIQVAMGWDNGHLHAFEIRGEQYSDIGMMEDAEDEDETTIKKLIGKGVSRFGYTYDFGDDWEHALLIEKKPPPPNSPPAPACVAGARACPPEDCGGLGGYYELLSAFEARNKPESGEKDEEKAEGVEDEEEDEEHDSESFYGDFDPEAFSLDEVNARLKAAFGRG